MRKHEREVARFVKTEAQKFGVTFQWGENGKHLKLDLWFSGRRRFVICGCTPSCPRAFKELRQQIRRECRFLTGC